LDAASDDALDAASDAAWATAWDAVLDAASDAASAMVCGGDDRGGGDSGGGGWVRGYSALTASNRPPKHIHFRLGTCRNNRRNPRQMCNTVPSPGAAAAAVAAPS